MRIAFVVERLELGGAESVALSLASEAAARGAHVEVIAIKRGGQLESQVPRAAQHVVLDRHRTAGSLLALRSHLTRSRPDAILSFTDHVNVLMLLAARGNCRPRTCATIHSPYDYTVEMWPPIKRWVTKPLIRRLYPRATAVVCVSRGVRDSYEQVMATRSMANVAVIPNPVLLPPERPATSARVGCPYRFLFVGRLAPEKDLATLLGAFERVARGIDAELLIFGEGIERRWMERQIGERNLAGRVRLMGFEPSLARIYGSGDCLVLSSRYESFGNVIVEALAYGCKVVSTDCPVGPREVLAGGQWGPLVPVGDVTALASAMTTVARGEFYLDDTALGIYLERFNRAVVLDEYLGIMGIMLPPRRAALAR